MRRLAKITDRLFGQPMFKLLALTQELEKQGKQVIHYEIGNPNFASPDSVVIETKRALDAGQTHYTNSMGLLEFREAIAEYTENNLGFKPLIDQIIACPANAIIDFIIRCIANPGDEVIIPDPGFPTYVSVLSYNNVVPVRIQLKEENEFRMRPDDISKKISSKSKLIILNSPHNPTGAVMRNNDVMEVAEIAKDADLFLLSDEVYSKLIYDKTHYSPSMFDYCKERTIILNSLSKAYAMSGWRLGYAIGPVQLIEKMGLLLQTILSCLPPFTQMGGITALKKEEAFITDIKAALRGRRDLLVDGLNVIKGIHCVKPDGAFYVFPRVEYPGMTAFEYAEKLLSEEGVCVLPGSFFGEYGSNFIRMSYSGVSKELINETLKRMERFHNKYF